MWRSRLGPLLLVRSLAILLQSLVVAGLVAPAAGEAPARPRVAVARFDPKGLPDGVNPNTLTDLLLEFGKDGLRHEAVLPTECLGKVVDRIRTEGVAAGKLPAADLAKAQARFVLLPSVSRLGDEWLMTATLVDLKSGDFRVAKASRKGGDAGQLKGMVPDLWRDLDSPALRATLRGHKWGVSPVLFSPDGKLLATASADKTARLWDVATGLEGATLKHEWGVRSVAFSPDGKLLATAGSSEKTARLWDVATGLERAVFKHDVDVLSVAFSPDGKLLATASIDNAARLWDVANGKERATLKHDPGVAAVAFSPDGKLLATGQLGGGGDRPVQLWNLAP